MKAERYARFRKADLQMQTPTDRANWRGHPLPQSPSEEDRQSAANDYIARCYEVGLEIIGITDHNLAGGSNDSLIPYLQRAIEDLSPSYGYRIILFPGFEIAAPIGKGAHLLCLFEPGTSVSTVSERLTRIGLPEDARFEEGAPVPVTQQIATLEDILNVVQGDPGLPGICILAHPTSSSGAMDSGTIAQWWSQDVIRNERLLCIEINKPRPEIISQEQEGLLKSVLLNKDPRYGRRWQIGAVCSSDCKRLHPEDGSTNYIGYRYCWIKMTAPSIESLRQAFLDHQSRIRFGSPPEAKYDYPKIRRVKISNASFMSDIDISFSPNMVNVIGGGGSGKSTLVEYLRAALGQVGSIRDQDVRNNHKKLLKTVTDQTSIHIEIERDGHVWSLESKNGEAAAATNGEDIPDLRQFFPVRVYGQREIYAIAEDRESRVALLDGLIGRELQDVQYGADELLSNIREKDEAINREGHILSRRSELRTEELSLVTRLEHLKEMEEPLSEYRGCRAEQRLIEGVEEQVGAVEQGVQDAISGIDFSILELGGEAQDWPHAAEAQELVGRVRAEVESLQADLSTRAARFAEAVRELLEEAQEGGWKDAFEVARRDYAAMKQSLGAEDPDPEEYISAETRLGTVREEIKELDDELGSIGELREQRTNLLRDLRDKWDKEGDLRQRKASRLMDHVPKVAEGLRPFVEVVVDQYGDRDNFYEVMDAFVRDRRRLAQEDWRRFLDAAADATPNGTPPTQTVVSWMEELRGGEAPEQFPWSDDRRKGVLLEWLDERSCAEVELKRVLDKVSVRLYRWDGSMAGDLEGGLSVGQRCTAILALLLADDDAPAVVDQPEDELDNEFVYGDLVPLLRRVKEQRQLIISTHDPNIPVNGDAEMIIALEAREGRGRLKEVDGEPADGALDLYSVRRAVEDIMEGSEDAFRRRYEMYGF